MKFSSLSQEDANTFLFQSPIKDLKSGVASLPPQQLTACVSLLQTQDHTDSLQRLIAIIQATDEAARLEAVGKGFSVTQFLSILSAIDQHALPIEKLSPLLVGLIPAVFQQALMQISDSQLEILKQESLTEPLQHQLTLFIHAFERLCQEQEAATIQLYKYVEEQKLEYLTYQLLAQIENRIKEIRKSSEGYLAAIDQALAITWTTNRLDLITNLNQLKERFFHQVHQQIGSPRSVNYPASGIFGTLEQFLNGAFAPTTMSEDKESLSDEDAAIEGLAKFSIWYLPDYWEIGLLPNIHKPEELELDSEKFEEKERFVHRQLLFSTIQENLNKLNLFKVSDLKKFQIYSKTMLKEYIAKNQKLLLEGSQV